MKITNKLKTHTSIEYTKDEELEMFELLNDYRQHRLTATEGIEALSELISRYVADALSNQT